jgi:predicted small lipoprotein YifL
MALSAAAFAVLVLLTGCGKKAAPVAPGPADQIIYPKQYPSPGIQQD